MGCRIESVKLRATRLKQNGTVELHSPGAEPRTNGAKEMLTPTLTLNDTPSASGGWTSERKDSYRRTLSAVIPSKTSLLPSVAILGRLRSGKLETMPETALAESLAAAAHARQTSGLIDGFCGNRRKIHLFPAPRFIAPCAPFSTLKSRPGPSEAGSERLVALHEDRPRSPSDEKERKSALPVGCKSSELEAQGLEACDLV